MSTGKGRIRASIEEGKIWVSTIKSRIQAGTGDVGSGRVPEMWDLGEYQKCGIRVSTEKGRILASTREVEIRASTRNVGSGRVPEMWDLGEHREGRNPGEYRRR